MNSEGRLEEVCDICRKHCDNPEEHAHGWMMPALWEHHKADAETAKRLKAAEDLLRKASETPNSDVWNLALSEAIQRFLAGEH